MWYCWPKYFLSVWFVLTHVSIKKREVLHWIYYCKSAIHKIFSKYILYRKLPFLCFKFIWNSHWQYIWKWHGTNIFSIEVIGRGTKYILVRTRIIRSRCGNSPQTNTSKLWEFFRGGTQNKTYISRNTLTTLSKQKHLKIQLGGGEASTTLHFRAIL